jgi:hypothetical protein
VLTVSSIARWFISAAARDDVAALKILVRHGAHLSVLRCLEALRVPNWLSSSRSN